MSNRSYERLAKALEALPGGFPETQSRVELSILRRAFTEEEAELTGYMSRKYESADDLASKVGFSLTKTKELLQDLLTTALVRKRVLGTQGQYR